MAQYGDIARCEDRRRYAIMANMESPAFAFAPPPAHSPGSTMEDHFCPLCRVSYSRGEAFRHVGCVVWDGGIGGFGWM